MRASGCLAADASADRSARSARNCSGARVAAAALAVCLIGGCAAPARRSGDGSPGAGFDRPCTSATRARHATGAEAALTSDALRAGHARMAARGFSRTATDIAGAIDALPLLERLSALRTERGRGPDAELRLLRLRQAMTDKILLAMLDVSSTLAVIDCEGERGDGLRVRLQAAETRRARRLGLASIMVGAATAALSGGLSLGGAAAAGNVAGISGGTAEASVATALLFGQASGELRTEGNVLREVWERPVRSGLFPRAVWRYLTKRPTDGADRRTPAEALAAEWRAGERFGPAGSRVERDRIGLLFGSGGIYTVEDLEMRDAMLDLLEASIALMSEDLRVLLIELLGQPPSRPPPQVGKQ